MSGEDRNREDFGALQGCFVDGDAEQRARRKKIRRRALMLSVAAQSVMLAAVIIMPLFAKPERIALPSEIFIPIPPYAHHRAEQQVVVHTQQQRTRNPCWLCPPTRIPTATSTRVDSTPEPTGSGSFDGNSHVNLRDGLIPGSDTRTPPPPTREIDKKTSTIVHFTHLDPAMLIRRVEPLYPPLARQTRREGRVELHAIIAADGTVQSLQIVSGDVLFHQSALEAVAQWRYRPTVLNGQAVQVDTTITVLYKLAQ